MVESTRVRRSVALETMGAGAMRPEAKSGTRMALFWPLPLRGN